MDSQVAILGATLVLLSAAIQRFLEVTDWLWTRLASGWAKASPLVKTTTGQDEIPAELLAEKKAQVTLIVSTMVGFWVSGMLVTSESLAALKLPFFAENPTPFAPINEQLTLIRVVVALMISGGTESTNSIVKWLQGVKDAKAADAALKKAAAGI